MARLSIDLGTDRNRTTRRIRPVPFAFPPRRPARSPPRSIPSSGKGRRARTAAGTTDRTSDAGRPAAGMLPPSPAIVASSGAGGPPRIWRRARCGRIASTRTIVHVNPTTIRDMLRGRNHADDNAAPIPAAGPRNDDGEGAGRNRGFPRRARDAGPNPGEAPARGPPSWDPPSAPRPASWPAKGGEPAGWPRGSGRTMRRCDGCSSAGTTPTSPTCRRGGAQAAAMGPRARKSPASRPGADRRRRRRAGPRRGPRRRPGQARCPRPIAGDHRGGSWSTARPSPATWRSIDGTKGRPSLTRDRGRAVTTSWTIDSMRSVLCRRRCECPGDVPTDGGLPRDDR